MSNNPMKIEHLDPIPPLGNPFHYDQYNMGQLRGKDLYLMYANHSTEECKFLILVNTKTGQRVQINVQEVFKDAPKKEMDHDCKQLHEYRKSAVMLHFIAGNERAAQAAADGFVWTSSTDTHDVYLNTQFNVLRFVRKDDKKFYEMVR